MAHELHDANIRLEVFVIELDDVRVVHELHNANLRLEVLAVELDDAP